MKKFLEEKYKIILPIIKYGCLISALFAITIIPPPIEPYINNNLIKTFAVIVLAFLLVVMYIYQAKKYFKNWIRLFMLFTLLFFGILFFYLSFKDRYVILYDNSTIVVGNEINANKIESIKKLSIEEGIDLCNVSKYNNQLLLKYNGGQAELIWTEESINNNKLCITTLFYALFLAGLWLMAAIIQSLQIVFSKD